MTRQLLLVGGSGADAEALARFSTPASRGVVATADTLEAALEVGRALPRLDSALVVAGPDRAPSAGWMAALRAAHPRVTIVAATSLSDAATRDAWVAAGADGFAVLPGFEGLTATLLQVDREAQRQRDLFYFCNDTIVLNRVEPDGRIVCEDINPACERTTGLSRAQAIGKTVFEVLPLATAERMTARYRQCIEARAPISYEHRLELPAGTRTYSTSIVPVLDDDGAVIRLASFARDVTGLHEAERLSRLLEARAAEAQKNDALSRLASHIAHDVNNLLALVAAHASACQSAGAPVAESLEGILEATRRGAELTRQVLTFGKPSPAGHGPVDAGALVSETLRVLAPTTTQLTVRQLSGGPARVHGDQSQLSQALTNLVSNAVQSMPTGGTLTVGAEPVTLEAAFTAEHPPLTPGAWVRLSVRDSGQGMDTATKRRVFEPYFTTRGAGTGLGLAVVQSVVASHGGAIVVESSPGEGSRFDVYLPSLTAQTSQPGQGQHLMLIDDHPGMARVSAKLLETLGYRATVFEDPVAALERFRRGPDDFDAVLTDLSMPRLSGTELTREVHALRPKVPVIISTGRITEADDLELAKVGVNAVLLKPWRLEDALATLSRLLPGPATPR